MCLGSSFECPCLFLRAATSGCREEIPGLVCEVLVAGIFEEVEMSSYQIYGIRR